MLHNITTTSENTMPDFLCKNSSSGVIGDSSDVEDSRYSGVGVIILLSVFVTLGVVFLFSSLLMKAAAHSKADFAHGSLIVENVELEEEEEGVSFKYETIL